MCSKNNYCCDTHQHRWIIPIVTDKREEQRHPAIVAVRFMYSATKLCSRILPYSNNSLTYVESDLKLIFTTAPQPRRLVFESVSPIWIEKLSVWFTLTREGWLRLADRTIVSKERGRQYRLRSQYIMSVGILLQTVIFLWLPRFSAAHFRGAIEA